jgi:hypothetical protein
MIKNEVEVKQTRASLNVAKSSTIASGGLQSKKLTKIVSVPKLTRTTTNLYQDDLASAQYLGKFISENERVNLPQEGGN